MRTDLESQLRDLGERFRSELTHVHPDEILDAPPRDTAPNEGALIGTVDHQGEKSRRAIWMAAAAAVSILVLIGGLVMTSQRNVPEGSANQPTPTTSSTSAATVTPGPPGAMLLPDDVGMQLTNLTFSDDGSLMNDDSIRWYATEQTRPETGPYLRVLSIKQQVVDDAWFDCAIYAPDGRKVLLDDGTFACLEHRSDAETIGRAFAERTPSLVIVEGNATDDELLAAANHVAPAAYGPGFEVTDPGLPDGVTATGIGWTVSDFAAASLDDASGPMVQAHWEDDDGRMIFYVASRGNVMSNHRLGYDTITDITVRGQPGFIRTYEDQPNYVGVVWQENDMTYQVGSQRLGEDQLLDLIEQLQLATMDEWDAATATDMPTTAPSDTTAPSGTTAPTSSAGYIPLALSEPPEGYRLVSARWGTGSGGEGSAVYANPDTSNRLEIVSTRSDRRAPTVTEPGDATWKVGRYTVTVSSETGCSRERCGIVLQWDPHTLATLTWSGPEGGDLEPGVTIEALLDLVPQLAPSGSVPAVRDLVSGTSNNPSVP